MNGTRDAALALSPLLKDLDADQRAWIARRVTTWPTRLGEVLFAEGEPPRGLYLLLHGELTITRRADGRDHVLTRHRVGLGDPETDKPAAAHAFTGEIHLLSGTPYTGTGTITAAGAVALIAAADFDELLARCPQVARTMLPVLAWRIRAEEVRARERATLTALGTMAAGLAHELNNPAAAAASVAAELPTAIANLESACRGDSQRPGVTLPGSGPAASPLARAQAEDDLADWLDSHGIDLDGGQISVLADAGADTDWLDTLADPKPQLRQLCARLTVDVLIGDLRESLARITALVRDVRTYSQLDRAQIQDIDIHEGLDATLRLLSAKAGQIRVDRRYDPTVPRLSANAAELNQVWTNLIDNAYDAMGDHGQLTVSTRFDGHRVSVTIADTGPGIPPHARERLFEPFFTTKDIGRGTGLGLHIAYRIVAERHRGCIEVHTRPGATRFVVTLPATSPSPTP